MTTMIMVNSYFFLLSLLLLIVIHTRATRQPSNHRVMAGIDPAFFQRDQYNQDSGSGNQSTKTLLMLE